MLLLRSRRPRDRGGLHVPLHPHHAEPAGRQVRRRGGRPGGHAAGQALGGAAQEVSMVDETYHEIFPLVVL